MINSLNPAAEARVRPMDGRRPLFKALCRQNNVPVIKPKPWSHRYILLENSLRMRIFSTRVFRGEKFGNASVRIAKPTRLCSAWHTFEMPGTERCIRSSAHAPQRRAAEIAGDFPGRNVASFVYCLGKMGVRPVKPRNPYQKTKPKNRDPYRRPPKLETNTKNPKTKPKT